MASWAMHRCFFFFVRAEASRYEVAASVAVFWPAVKRVKRDTDPTSLHRYACIQALTRFAIVAPLSSRVRHGHSPARRRLPQHSLLGLGHRALHAVRALGDGRAAPWVVDRCTLASRLQRIRYLKRYRKKGRTSGLVSLYPYIHVTLCPSLLQIDGSAN